MAVYWGESWLVDNIELNQAAFGIETLGGRHTVPPRFGEDLSIPYYPGQVYRAKNAGARTITLAMRVTDVPAFLGGTYPHGKDGYPISGVTASLRRARFDANMRLLRNLFNKHGQFNLTRTWQDLDYNIDAITTRSATAKAEIAGPMQVVMSGRYLAKVTVDLKLADPYFYEPSSWPPDIGGTGFTLSVGLGSGVTFYSPGDANIIPQMNFSGSATGLTVTNLIWDPINSVLVNTISFTYTDAISGGAVFFPLLWVCNNASPKFIEHSGSFFWMEFANRRHPFESESIENQITVTGSGSGTMTFEYKTPYL